MEATVNKKLEDAVIVYEQKHTYSRNKEDRVLHGIPVDYSFLNLKNLYAVEELDVGTDRLGSLPEKGPKNRFLSSSVWLDNNKLTSIDNLSVVISYSLEVPEALTWLDLSFNNIGSISDELLKYPNLSILYLHANNIRTLRQVKKLRMFKNLRKLTLCGNPLETIYLYRSHVVNILPQIESFDFSLVLPLERTKTSIANLPYIKK